MRFPVPADSSTLFHPAAGEANWLSPVTIQFTNSGIETPQTLGHFAALISEGKFGTGPNGITTADVQEAPALIQFLRRWGCPHLLSLVCHQAAQALARRKITDVQAFVVGAVAEDVHLCFLAVADEDVAPLHPSAKFGVADVPLNFWCDIGPEYLFALATMRREAERMPPCSALCDARVWRELLELGKSGLEREKDAKEKGETFFPLLPCSCHHEKEASEINGVAKSEG